MRLDGDSNDDALTVDEAKTLFLLVKVRTKSFLNNKGLKFLFLSVSNSTPIALELKKQFPGLTIVYYDSEVPEGDVKGFVENFYYLKFECQCSFAEVTFYEKTDNFKAYSGALISVSNANIRANAIKILYSDDAVVVKDISSATSTVVLPSIKPTTIELDTG